MISQFTFRFDSTPVTVAKHFGNHNVLIHRFAVGQSGAVLIISLIVLLLLTLIGVSSIQTTTLEEKMAGNYRDKNLAFQAAEAALRHGEALAKTINPLTISAVNNGINSTGIYQNPKDEPLQNFSWNNDAAIGIYKEGRFNQFKFPPRFIIEILQPRKTNGCSLNASSFNEPNCITYWFRITAQASGAIENTVVKLQSIFVR
jgi:type IV pilus assembly protein PilX